MWRRGPFEAATVDIPNAAAPSLSFPLFGIPLYLSIARRPLARRARDGRRVMRDRELILQIRRLTPLPRSSVWSFRVPPTPPTRSLSEESRLVRRSGVQRVKKLFSSLSRKMWNIDWVLTGCFWRRRRAVSLRYEYKWFIFDLVLPWFILSAAFLWLHWSECKLFLFFLFFYDNGYGSSALCGWVQWKKFSAYWWSSYRNVPDALGRRLSLTHWDCLQRQTNLCVLKLNSWLSPGNGLGMTIGRGALHHVSGSHRGVSVIG